MNRIGLWFVMLLLAGCAVTPTRLYKDPFSVSDANLFKTIHSTYTACSFQSEPTTEVKRPVLTAETCKNAIAAQKTKALLGARGEAAVGHAIHETSNGGGRQGYYVPTQDWDALYNEHEQLVWQGINTVTGLFTYDYRWAGMVQTDRRWPGE